MRKLIPNNKISLLPDSKLSDTFRKLDSLKEGVIIPITDPDNIPFIKQYIDCYHTVEFNQDYSKFRKVTPI